MNQDSDNRRYHRSAALLPLAACVLVVFAAVADDDVQALFDAGRRVPPPDLDARSDFRVADIVAHEYLVVTVTITADGVDTEGATLARAPEKANGVVDDLRVKAFDGTSLIAEYAMADPRIVRWRAAGRFTPGHETEIRSSARSEVFIPLSAAIVKVVIESSPNSPTDVSKGGEFNPKPLAIEACRTRDRTRFPACADLGFQTTGLTVVP